MAYKKGQDRHQRVLFPDCIDEYVEADAPVRLFDAFVDSLKMDELGFVRSTPAETGTPGYNPRDLLKLYIYGYFYQVRSSRKLARECKCASLSFGKGHSYFKYDSDIQIFRGAQMQIGSCATNIGLKIVCSDKIVMGNDVHIGRDVWIRDNNGGHHVIIKGYKDKAPIHIGDHVWICSNVSITKGVTIGEGAIISANSVVTTNIPAHCIASGNPAKVIAENVYWRP